MKDKRIFMLYPKFPPNKTGILVSLLRRANLLAWGGFKVVLMTVEHDLRTRKYFEDIYEAGLLTNRENIEFINLFSYYQLKNEDNSCPLQQKSDEIYVSDRIGNKIFKDDKNKINRYEVFKKGLLTHINFFDEGKIRHRTRYDDYGRLCSCQNLSNDLVVDEDFYDIYNRIVLKIDYFYPKEKRKIKRIHLFDNNGMVERTFKNIQELFEYTIHRYLCCDLNTLYYFFIDKAIFFVDFLLKNTKKNYALIGTIHAAHYLDHRDINSKPNRNYDHYFNNLDKLSALIILTDKQKRDIESRYGTHKCFKTIPHTLDKAPQISQSLNDPFHFVSLARYDRVKRLDLLIEIFSDVVAEFPLAKLDLYGYGLEKNNLEQMIEAYNMQDNIFLKPYVANVNELLQTSSMLLLTSQSESFCLVVMEALANGCPVISFDINYGPSEMIIDKQNGFLIVEGNKQGYSQQIIEYLKNQDELYAMRSRALELSVNMSPAVILGKWRKLFDDIEQELTV
nr:glycosyltransferase [Acinetobacter sp. Marseille-Q1620]